MPPDGSLRRRLTVAAGLAVALITAAGLAASWVLIRRNAERAIEADLRQTGAALLAGLQRDAAGELTLDETSEPVRYQRVGSGWYWQIAQDGRIRTRSRSLAADSLPDTAEGRSMLNAQELTLVRLEGAGEAPFLVTLAAPNSAAAAASRSEFAPLATGLLAFSGMLALLLAALIRRMLAPLEVLVGDIGRLRAGDITELPPTGASETNSLAATINGLTADAASLVAANRDSAARLAHALKTPLARLAARAGAGGAKPDPEVLDAVDRMRRHIDHNLSRLRMSRGGTVEPPEIALVPVVEDLIYALGRQVAGKGVTIEAALPEGAAIRMPRDDLEELLGNLIENACRAARRKVVVAFEETTDRREIKIDDDGPGFDGIDSGELRFADWRRAEATGLGLPIAADIAAASGAELILAKGRMGGARTIVRFRRGPCQSGPFPP